MTETAEEFSAYVATRQRALIRTAYLLTGDHHSAEDLVQIALARTYVAWNRIRDKQGLDAYVRRTMINEHTGWWRRAWRRLEHSTDVVPDHSTRPGTDHAASSADRDEMWDLVCTLPPRQRAAVVLRYFEDLSEAETAEALGCSVGTVKSQTSRALATLRARLHQLAAATTEEGSR
ncbi:SigE family RNA polymerase sigma factor [Actinopolymorpha alba]|uniref:SigE family RNA polymerase sigma factor n=1 Tax=Actinopolymorpha alba TaxID=533267 RepID=UPI000382270A|nr:SigE family RNA polymerase sigma factor [Actinopolymorpha alba]